MIFRLIILNGERRSERITVSPDPMRIGRDPACEIRFDDAEIANLHAEIAHKPEGLSIRDLGSMNRILVNNRETREAQLKHGDVVEVGRTRFLVQAYVQAEVAGEAREAKRRLWKKIGIVATIMVILAVATHRCRHQKPATPSRPPKAPLSGHTLPAAHTNKPGKTTPSPLVPVTIPQTPSINPEATPAEEPVPPSLIPAPIEEPSPALLATTNTPAATIPAEELAAAEAAIATSRTDAVAAEVERAKKELENAANELLQSRVRDMMAEARAASTNQSPEEAEQVLAGIQRVDPDFADAYLERARLLTERGRLAPAMDQLSTLVRRAPESPAAEKARAELLKLANAREHFVFPFAGRIKIADTELNKFPETATQKELRILSISLESSGQERTIDASAVAVEVRFYDRDPATGLIHPTTATLAPPPPLQGLWPERTRKTLSASYGVPAGAQRREQFYGCLVRVHYYGALQDEWMQPKDLPADVQMSPQQSRSP